MSAVSNFYFFAGMSVGNHFMWRLFAGMRFIDPAKHQDMKFTDTVKLGFYVPRI